MSQKIILPNQRDIADLSKAVRNSAQRQDGMQLNQYWDEPVTRAEMQQAMSHLMNEALHSFLLFLGDNFELTAKTPTGEKILDEIERLQEDGEAPADSPNDH